MLPIANNTNRESIPPNAVALTIYDLKLRGIGRTKAYEEIAAGRLIARKIGRKTVVLEADLIKYFDNLPKVQADALDPLSEFLA
ncbi:hypothetical protein M2322_000410 [Rhodoblastus acidophilus]|uniref:helix-turn-helix domain-containing protein n=1 Tax=Rhodoblastus acidophilus TaxID=1074 RepID=UPI0022251496|nr:helix-turn-helix domain-containing protein [Rhodoblastus acidophilus]MCW2314890.1 hypothetical protein [Rhodoblastus acidophilus]